MVEIAEELCLTQRYLRALEQNDLNGLPGVFFYKSFVKQYAALLGVPEGLIQPGLDALVPQEPASPVESQAPWSSGQARSTAPPVRELDPLVQATNQYYFADRRIGVSVGTLAAVVVVCSFIYAWWNKPSKPANRTSTAVAQVQAKSAEPALNVSTPSVNLSDVANLDDLSHVVLNLSATERTWIMITSDGKQIFAGMLEPSQTKTVSGVEAAWMKVGNAGGLEVRLNGKAIGPLGARGQVREVIFKPGNNFQILEPGPAGPATTL
jgi:cytoskeletal protein RodZ